MGLGPSIKMTTLHHFRCPATQTLLRDETVDFVGVIVSGVSENYDDKLASAQAVGGMAQQLGLDGALVAIDGWGNHHIDFVSVIEQLGLRGIPAVGLSYIGRQGRLVCSNEYVKTIIDFNKSASGYESCVVGQNNLTALDAYKALGILKIKLHGVRGHAAPVPCRVERCSLPLARLCVTEAPCAVRYDAAARTLTLPADIAREKRAAFARLERVTVRALAPGQHSGFVNSNLDFMPIAKKEAGTLGEGRTCVLRGAAVMLTGAEAGTGYQPANIGSSEGVLAERVEFGQAGTPRQDDWLLHIDVRFRPGEGRTAAGIAEAHAAADCILDEVRAALPPAPFSADTETFCGVPHPGRPAVALVKLVSGLGAMYDTALFPAQPGGFAGARLLREQGNLPVLLTPAQVLDGAIHSLI